MVSIEKYEKYTRKFEHHADLLLYCIVHFIQPHTAEKINDDLL